METPEDKKKLTQETIDSFFKQFEPMDDHTKLVLQLILEIIFKGKNE